MTQAQRVLIQHEVNYNGRGDVNGIRFRKHAGRGVITNVVHSYIHKEDGYPVVRLGSGDIWKVKPISHPEYEFVTLP